MISQHAPLAALLQQTIAGLGFDLIEVERLAGGLLRVIIDHPYVPAPADAPDRATPTERFITADDCERVTRQLQYVLEVESVDYKRLEVSSPGIDRLLRNEQDLMRFCGHTIDLTLKEAVGQAAEALGAGIAPNRKKFQGVLEKTPPGWQIVWRDAIQPAKPGAKVSSAKRAAAKTFAMAFTWGEIREARLAPLINFKGRAPAKANEGALDA